MTSLSTDILSDNVFKYDDQQPSISNTNSFATASAADFKDDVIKGVDFWYYDIGANVIPTNSKTKMPNIPSWKPYQENPVTEKQHEEWKKTGAFKNGLAVVAGKLWRGPHKDKYLVINDCDNKRGIDEFLEHCFPKIKRLEDLSQQTIVEQHLDNKGKAHIYFIVDRPLRNRPGINGTKKEKDDCIPIIEVKSEGKSYVVCSPSIHKEGQRYEILGTTKPAILDKEQSQSLEDKLDKIYNKYGDGGTKDNNYLIPINELFKNGFAVTKGSRHSTILRVMDSLIQKNKYCLSEESIKKLGYDWNRKHCDPPLDGQEVERQWKCAKDFINKNSEGLVTANTNNNQQTTSSMAERTSLVELATEEIMSAHHFLTFEESKEILYYRDGVYVPGGETIIEKQAEGMLKYSLKNKDIEEIKGHVRRQTYRSRKEIDSDINIINLRNGLYDINRNELRPHSQSYYSINQKPVVYEPKAKPKMFGNFLSQVLYPHEIRTAIEVMGYTFYRDCPFEHFFKLFGYGANGKSVFTGLLTKMHGEKNVSNVSLTSLVDNRFALSELEFKDVNIDAELSVAVIKDTSLLKKLTGGRKQPIRIEQKYKHAYDTYLHAKLFFNANNITDTTDQTAAYYRRQIIISFPNTFEGKTDDPQLLNKLTSEEEMSGIFNVAMHALRTLLKNSGIYLNEKSIESRTAKHERAVNPVKAFVAEAISEESTESDYIVKADLYTTFKKYCNKYSLAPKNEIALGKDLKKLGWADGRERKGEKRRTCWFGRKIKSEFVCVDEQQQVTLWTN